ncbi:hypothetical protein [uncultured Gimesia sp.]|uniref:hypothetical protein n=1 Tax=uncultured Gimesia sp. TaxID=1678688 RepID=UPI00262FF189|nr:hypothetical protein [uncultured Gimesia sp.]
MNSVKSLGYLDRAASAMIFAGIGYFLLSRTGEWGAALSWGLMGLGSVLILASPTIAARLQRNQQVNIPD